MYINALVRQGNHTQTYAEQAFAGRIQLNSLDAARVAAQIDSRVKVDDMSTWVQTRVKTEAEKAEIDRKNAIVEATALIRAGADLDEQLNRLKREQIDLTQEEVDRLRETARESLSKRWETVAGQAERDRKALSSERAKQELSLSYKMPESTLKYIEQYAEALLGEGGFGKLYNMHGGAKEFYDAYSQGRLFTPIAEQALSDQTRNLMSKNNLSLDTAGLESAKNFVREQEELSKTYAADKAAKEAEIAETEKKIAKVKQEIAETDKEIAGLAKVINKAEDFGKSAKVFADTLNSFSSEILPDWMVPEAPEPEELTSEQRAKLKEMQSDSLHKGIELEALGSSLRELEAAAQEDNESSKKAAQAAENMAKAADEMRKYYEFNNIDRELQARLEEAEAVELGKMLNSQVDLRKAAQDQFDIDRTAFSSRGDGKKIAEAQARAMIEAAGLTVNESSLKQLADDIYRAQNEQRKVGIQRTMQSQFYANEDFVMSQLGPRGAGMKAVADAVRQFGDALTQEQKDLIGRSAELKAMSSQGRELQRTGSQILTNDLTSRGGFRSGAVRTGHDNLNAVLQNQKQSLQIFRQMDATNRRIEQLLTM